MGTTTNKLSYLTGTKEKLAEKIIDLGGDITDNTTFREYANELQAIYNNADKVSAEGSNIQLQGCNKGKMVIQPKGNTELLLPDEYQQVEYIENTGEQYINLNETASIDCEIGIDCYVTYTDGNRFIMGCRGNRCSAIIGFQPNLVYQFGEMSSSIFNKSITLNQRYKILANNTGCYVDNDLYYEYSGTMDSQESLNHIKLFATSNTYDNVESYASRGTKIYNAYVKKAGKYTINLIPCYRKSDNIIGMYDTVNNVFYTNAGTGTFLKGEDYQTIKNVTGNNKVKISGKNLLSNNFEDYSIGNPYGYYKIIDDIESYNLVMSLIDEDTSIDMSNIYFGFSTVGTAATGGVYWIMDNGNEKTKKISTNNMKYFSFYPNNQATFNKIFSRYKIQVEIRNDLNPTEYEPYITPIEKELNLGTIELCKIGNNSDLIFKNEPNNPNYDNTLIENGWYKKNCIKKQKFQNKSFNFSAYWTGDVVSYAYVEYGKSTLKCTDMLFTHFEKVANRSSVGFFLLDAVLYLNFNKDTLGVTTENTYAEHTEALKNFFTNNDVQFMYDTTEIAYTQITETTLVNQLEDLARTIIQVPTINIETESDEDNAQLIVNASALKSS